MKLTFCCVVYRNNLCGKSGVCWHCAESGHMVPKPHLPLSHKPYIENEARFWMWTDDVMLWAVSVTSFLAVLYMTTVAQVALYMYLREHLVCADVTCDNSPLPKLKG